MQFLAYGRSDERRMSRQFTILKPKERILPGMAQVFDHPIRQKPYNLLEFVRRDGNGVTLYKVRGSNKSERRAFEALGEAFALAGGCCFYCRKSFKPQKLDKRIVHRDHVVPSSRNGTDHLHNLLIACAACGAMKGAEDIFDFRPSAAKRYQNALGTHLRECIDAGAIAVVLSPSSPPRRARAAAGGP